MNEIETVTIDLPGRFDSFFEGTSEAAGENGKTPLYVAYHGARSITRGRGYTMRLTIPLADAQEALEVLKRYAESCIDCNQDLMSDPDTRREVAGEVAAAKLVRERVVTMLRDLPRQEPVVAEPVAQPDTKKTAAEVFASFSSRQQELALRWLVDSYDLIRMPSVPLDVDVENLFFQISTTWQGPRPGRLG